jgi:LL-diaminopimelate aminotransferase
MNPSTSSRIKQLPVYLFRKLEDVARESELAGRPVINLAIGDPDRRPADRIVGEMREVALSETSHGYAPSRGSEPFREAVSLMFESRYGVTLDPDSEVVALIGSKEGLGHMGLAVLNPGDRAIVPEPGYPVYHASVILANGTPVYVTLRESNGFLPDLADVEKAAVSGAKMLYLNYPNNPTGAIAPREYLAELVGLAARHGLLICYDAAYAEIVFGGGEPVSILATEGARDVAVEFHSFSKTFSMTGWRVGYAVGNRIAIHALARLKSNLDSGIFAPISCAARQALEILPAVANETVRTYEVRRDLVLRELGQAGYDVFRPQGAFYVWAKTPAGQGSEEFCLSMLQGASVLLAPGAGFGPSGEGWFRISLTQSEDVLREALARMRKVSAWTK